MELEEVKRIVSEVMKVDPKELSRKTTFVEDLGADSLDICRILMNVEEAFLIKLPEKSISSVVTIEDVLTLIRKIKKA